MRWLHLASAVAVALGLIVVPASASEMSSSPGQVTILAGSIDRDALSAPDVTVDPDDTIDAPAAPDVTGTILAVPSTVLAAPVLDPVVIEYVLRQTPPDDLIRYVWRDETPATIERALEIACREGGMGKGSGRTWQVACSPSHRQPAVSFDPSCGADNPTSSASGLVQFIGSWRGWGGFDWAKIVGRDCFEDVQMFYAAWQANGWGPWS